MKADTVLASIATSARKVHRGDLMEPGNCIKVVHPSGWPTHFPPTSSTVNPFVVGERKRLIVVSKGEFFGKCILFFFYILRFCVMWNNVLPWKYVNQSIKTLFLWSAWMKILLSFFIRIFEYDIFWRLNLNVDTIKYKSINKSIIKISVSSFAYLYILAEMLRISIKFHNNNLIYFHKFYIHIFEHISCNTSISQRDYQLNLPFDISKNSSVLKQFRLKTILN